MFKRYTGYNSGDEIWLRTCDAGHSNSIKAGKYWFSYDQGSGLIFSEGSRDNDPGNVLCLKMNSVTRLWKQRVKLDRCDNTDDLQKFDYVNGKIYARANHRLCAGYEYDKFEANGQAALILSTCYPNGFAVNF